MGAAANVAASGLECRPRVAHGLEHKRAGEHHQVDPERRRAARCLPLGGRDVPLGGDQVVVVERDQCAQALGGQLPADRGLRGELGVRVELGQRVVELAACESDPCRLVVIDGERVREPQGLRGAPSALDRRRRIVEPVQPREHQPQDHVRACVVRLARRGLLCPAHTRLHQLGGVCEPPGRIGGDRERVRRERTSDFVVGRVEHGPRLAHRGLDVALEHTRHRDPRAQPVARGRAPFPRRLGGSPTAHEEHHELDAQTHGPLGVEIAPEGLPACHLALAERARGYQRLGQAGEKLEPPGARIG